MFNDLLVMIFILSSTLVTLLFWGLTIVEVFYNKNINNYTKTTVYECGFLTVNKNAFPVTLNVITLLFFVVIYEVEFILLVPFLISLNFLQTKIIVFLTLLFFIITITLYWDFWLNKINWVY